MLLKEYRKVKRYHGHPHSTFPFASFVLFSIYTFIHYLLRQLISLGVSPRGRKVGFGLSHRHSFSASSQEVPQTQHL